MYGDGGIILRTTNWGENWQQINLNDSLCLLDMLYFEGKFYGIPKFQYLVYSSDDGNTWELRDFGYNTRFYKLFLFDGNLVLVTRGKILFLRKDLKPVKEIEIPRKGNFFVDEYLEITQIANDYLIFQYANYELCLLSLKNGTYKIVPLPNLINSLIKKIIVSLMMSSCFLTMVHYLTLIS